MKVPISDSGIATIGISTERGEPRNSEHHERDDQQRLDQRADDLVDRAVHEVGGVVDDLAVQALRQLRLDAGEDRRARR